MSGAATGRKGPIPAVAIKEAKEEAGESRAKEVPNGHVNGCEEELGRLRLADAGQTTPVNSQATAVNDSQATAVKDSQVTAGDNSLESAVHDSQTSAVKNSSPAAAINDSHPTAVNDSQDTAADDSLPQSDASAKRTPCCSAQSSESRQRVEKVVPSSCDQTVSVSGSHPPPDASGSGGVSYHIYENELNMPDIMRLIQKDLSEPYSIYTYRYFIHNWPNLCFMARVGGECVGAIVCKLDYHKKVVKRGYIAMLAVDSKFRKRAIGSTLVQRAIEAMNAQEADEVVLETEITNRPALRLYENLGFVRDKRLFRYYLNGVDALRLKLWLR